MSKVKRQHYLPQFYLRSFVGEGQNFFVCQRHGGKLGKIRKSKPKHECCGRYLYEVKRNSSKQKNDYLETGCIEKRLGECESRLAPCYRNLLTSLDKGSLSKTDSRTAVDDLVALIAFFIVRNPSWLNTVRNKADNLSKVLIKNDFLSKKDQDQLVKEGLSDELRAISELAIMDTVLFSMSEGAPLRELVELMGQMDCLFMKAVDGSEFITSSFPVYAAWEFTDDDDPTGIYFPLSPLYAAVLKMGKGNDRLVAIRSASAEEVDSLNRAMMNGNGAWELLVARDRGVLEELLKDYRFDW